MRTFDSLRSLSMTGLVLLLLTTFLQAEKKNYSWNIVNPWGNNRYKWGNTGYGSRYDSKVKDFNEDYYYNGFQFDNDVYAFPRYRYTYSIGDESGDEAGDE